jgi:hypothetical protein
MICARVVAGSSRSVASRLANEGGRYRRFARVGNERLGKRKVRHSAHASSTPRLHGGQVRLRRRRYSGARIRCADQFGGNVRLALSGWYQGARAVRERGIFDDTKEFVRIVLALYGTV